MIKIKVSDSENFEVINVPKTKPLKLSQLRSTFEGCTGLKTYINNKWEM